LVHFTPRQSGHTPLVLGGCRLRFSTFSFFFAPSSFHPAPQFFPYCLPPHTPAREERCAPPFFFPPRPLRTLMWWGCSCIPHPPFFLSFFVFIHPIFLVLNVGVLGGGVIRPSCSPRRVTGSPQVFARAKQSLVPPCPELPCHPNTSDGLLFCGFFFPERKNVISPFSLPVPPLPSSPSPKEKTCPLARQWFLWAAFPAPLEPRVCAPRVGFVVPRRPSRPIGRTHPCCLVLGIGGYGPDAWTPAKLPRFFADLSLFKKCAKAGPLSKPREFSVRNGFQRSIFGPFPCPPHKSHGVGAPPLCPSRRERLPRCTLLVQVPGPRPLNANHDFFFLAH